MRYSTIIGIDTQSKKNAVCAIVHSSGEMRETILSEDPKWLLAWIPEQDFPKPIGCVYESGPTGFGALELHRARTVRVEADPPMEVQYDGEPTSLTTPFTARILPRAARFHVSEEGWDLFAR